MSEITQTFNEVNEDIKAVVTITYNCDVCGDFDVIKSKSTMLQFCAGCGKRANPMSIESVGVKIDGVWKLKKLEE